MRTVLLIGLSYIGDSIKASKGVDIYDGRTEYYDPLWWTVFFASIAADVLDFVR